jgi:hypothetical protein
VSVNLNLWREVAKDWTPWAGTQHPYHATAAYAEVMIPQDLVASSHPAAGSTASLTITNPGTTTQGLVLITGATASVLNTSVASAGGNFSFTITGSIGGQYTAEGLSVPATAFTIDRTSYRGQNFVSGNGVGANQLENMTVAFSAGIANLIQRMDIYYHFGN